jgi:hypothetical protein
LKSQKEDPLSQPKPSTPSTGHNTAELRNAVTTANTESADLEKAVTQIVDQIGLPVLRQALSRQPELKHLNPALVVDLMSSSLAADLFSGAGPDDDVIVQLQNGYVTVPATEREFLQSGVTRVLAKRAGEIEQLLAKGL